MLWAEAAVAHCICCAFLSAIIQFQNVFLPHTPLWVVFYYYKLLKTWCHQNTRYPQLLAGTFLNSTYLAAGSHQKCCWSSPWSFSCAIRGSSLLQFALIFWQLVSELLEQRPGIPWLWSSMQLVKSSSGLEKSFRSAIMAFIYWFICLFLLLWCPGGDKEDGMEWNGDASWGCRRCSSVRYTVAGGPMKPTAQYLWVVPGCLISCSHSQK